MKKYKGWWTLLGYALLAIGFLALVLSIVGVKFAFLLWIDAPGPLFGFVVRLLMMFGGIIIIYLAQTDFEGKEHIN